MTRHAKGTPAIIGLLCIALGLWPLSIALGVVAVPEASLHAPLWVVALSGVAFVIGGCMILLAGRPGMNDFLAGVLCLIFALVGAWVALFGPDDGFSGGISLLPPAANVTLGRWVFGSGAILSLAISVYALRRAFQSSR